MSEKELRHPYIIIAIAFMQMIFGAISFTFEQFFDEDCDDDVAKFAINDLFDQVEKFIAMSRSIMRDFEDEPSEEKLEGLAGKFYGMGAKPPIIRALELPEEFLNIVQAIESVIDWVTNALFVWMDEDTDFDDSFESAKEHAIDLRSQLEFCRRDYDGRY